MVGDGTPVGGQRDGFFIRPTIVERLPVTLDDIWLNRRGFSGSFLALGHVVKDFIQLVPVIVLKSILGLTQQHFREYLPARLDILNFEFTVIDQTGFVAEIG